MKRGKVSAAVLPLLIAALSVAGFACAKPTAELERAQDAVAQAKQAGAAEYAPDRLDDAEMALMYGREQMDNMQYDQARDNFERAYKMANQARDKAQAASDVRGIFQSEGSAPAAEAVPLPAPPRIAPAPESGPMRMPPPSPMAPPSPTPAPTYSPPPVPAPAPSQYPLPATHRVRNGETLWLVSAYRDIYDDPYQWPLIYDANRAMIDKRSKVSGLKQDVPDNGAHWIFPGQELDIPRNVSVDRINNARARAGAPAPYVPPGQ